MKIKQREKTEFIGIRVRPLEKAMLEQRAKACKKSLSQYLVDAGLETNIDSAKACFYQSINEYLKYLVLTGFVQEKLLMFTLREQGVKTEKVVEFRRKAFSEAEKFFKENGLPGF